jgi:hypothetical protein
MPTFKVAIPADWIANEGAAKQPTAK